MVNEIARNRAAHWAAGFATAVAGGLLADFLVTLLVAISGTPFSTGLGLLPGAAIVAIVFATKKLRHPFGQGCCVGAAIVALVGGFCGAMVGGG